jgi:hypothetical protein
MVVVVFVVLHVLGTSPNPVLFGALAVLLVCLRTTDDADVGPVVGPWAAGDLTSAEERLGSDHVTRALARDLADVRRDSVGGRELAARLHRRICAVLEARVWRIQGVDLRANAQFARRLLPEDLADIYLSPPDAALLRPERLDALLARIESW